MYTTSFNFPKFYIFPAVYLYVFTDLRKNREVWPIQLSVIGFYKREGKCLLRGSN